MHRIQAACGCCRGNVRCRNEDNFFFNGATLPADNDGLVGIMGLEAQLTQNIYFAVFDGMGGESHGSEAAFLSAQTLSEYAGNLETLPNGLLDICAKANERLCAVARKHRVETVGSTAAIICFSPTMAHIVNIGDSKVFLLRDGRFWQISVDHTDYKMQKLYGQVGRPPRLTQYLGVPPTEFLIEPYYVSIRIRSGDKFLLCSDGLTDSLRPAGTEKILSVSRTAYEAVEWMQRDALSIECKDNVTTIAAFVI